MTERMNQLYERTNELLLLLDENVSKAVEEREKIIENVNVLLNHREIILAEIKPPYTAEEKEIGIKLVPLEQKIQQRLNLLFTNIKTDMRTVKKQKSTNQKYMNPYQSLANSDGSYLDKRK
ncbi:flagellar protein FliT [Paraliobacillus sp. JSM ZJ581]|uniref:flagellar protein FliT n=1 Tax=Paraliobacillus sp. JSM ZJ581 TaxID=3342118 RepID=UPI0035A8C921